MTLRGCGLGGGLWLTLATLAHAQVWDDGRIPAGPEETPPEPARASPEGPHTAPTEAASRATGAPPPEVAPPAQLVELLEARRDARGRRCQRHQMVTRGALRYVACGASGVWIVRARDDGRFAIVDRIHVGGSALGFFVQAGQLWVRIARLEARPMAELDSAQTAAPGQRPAPPAAGPTGQPPRPPPPPAPAGRRRAEGALPATDARVLSTQRGRAVIGLGRGAGLREGHHVAFLVDDTDPRSRPTVVGEVESVGRDRAHVWIGLNQVVPAGTRVAPTSEPTTGSSIAPARAAGIWEVAWLARPFLVLENLGAGLFVDARAGYRGRDDFHVEALLQPLSLASAEDGSLTPAAAVVTGSYDSQLFEVGLGIGGQTVKDTDFGFEPGTGLTLAQRARLGARDGLHLEALSYVALFHSEFDLSDLRITAQIPFGSSTWLRLAGGGGSLGLGFGEVGVRVLLSGNGLQGSFFLTTVVGGVHVFEDGVCTPTGCEPSIDYAGPNVGIGAEWRL